MKRNSPLFTVELWFGTESDEYDIETPEPMLVALLRRDKFDADPVLLGQIPLSKTITEWLELEFNFDVNPEGRWNWANADGLIAALEKQVARLKRARAAAERADANEA
jgi:hypothetical protein